VLRSGAVERVFGATLALDGRVASPVPDRERAAP
jgi:hypothetical protein